MKTQFNLLKGIKYIFPALITLLLLSVQTQAQTKKGNAAPPSKKYSIHIIKEINGVKTEIDTTFESKDDFDVDAWVDSHDMGKNTNEKNALNEDSKTSKMEKEFKITIPDFDVNADGSISDTMIVNGDTIVMGDKFMQMLKDNPDLAELGKGMFFNMPFDAPETPEAPEMPGCCPLQLEGFGQYMPWMGMNLQEIMGQMPFGNLDQIVIKKKRHGKKIIIKFEERDSDEIIIRPPQHDRMYYRNDYSGATSGERRQMHREMKNSEKEAKKSMKVERQVNDGKEVIIIRKDLEEKK